MCIQALINSLLLPLSLASLPSWGTCQLHGCCAFPARAHVCMYVCVYASATVSLSLLFVSASTHSPAHLRRYHSARLASCVRLCEAYRSHRMEHNYPQLAVNPCPSPQTKACSHCIHKQTSLSSSLVPPTHYGCSSHHIPDQRVPLSLTAAF